MARFAQVSFFFLEPHELFYTSESADDRKADAEFDLLTVTDGIVHLCEIKSSKRDLDIAKFAEVAKRLRPNVAMLAVMEPNSSKLSGKLSELEEALSGTNIAAELIYLEEQDIDPSPILPNGRQITVRW